MADLELSIDALCALLAKEVACDQNRKPEKRQSYTATVCNDKDSGTYIIVNGSAHMMHGVFAELFKRRPELRGVVQDVLDSMYHIDMEQ